MRAGRRVGFQIWGGRCAESWGPGSRRCHEGNPDSSLAPGLGGWGAPACLGRPLWKRGGLPGGLWWDPCSRRRRLGRGLPQAASGRLDIQGGTWRGASHPTWGRESVDVGAYLELAGEKLGNEGEVERDEAVSVS